MPIPLATTTVTVKGRRPQVAIDPDAEGYDGPPVPAVVLVTGLRASITLPSFKRQVATSDQVDVFALRTDPFAINRFDTIIDESDGTEYEVTYAGPSKVETWGLHHTVCYIRLTRGLSSEGDTRVP